MKKLLLYILMGTSMFAFSQDDLMDLLGDEPTIDYATATFKGTRVVNFQSSEIPAKGVMQFMIMHRFGSMNDDYLYNFFGLDNAQIRLGLDYSIANWLNVGLGRSSASKTYDGFVKAKILRQSKGAKTMPVSLLYYGSMNYNSQRWNDNIDHDDSERLSYVNQVIIARKFNESISFQLSPTLVHFNFVETSNQPNDIYSLGMSGRVKVTNRIAITAEYNLGLTDNFYYVEGVKTPYEDALSLGVDIETGGHVFQFHITNSRGLSDPQWMTRTPGSWGNGDIYLGFNISRVFTLKKPKTVDAPTF